MDEVRASALREYEDALTYFLTHSPDQQDGDFDLRMRTRLYDADCEIEKQGLRGTPGYNEAVLRADRNASTARQRRFPSGSGGPVHQSRSPAECSLVSFEAKAPQPTSKVHNSA